MNIIAIILILMKLVILCIILINIIKVIFDNLLFMKKGEIEKIIIEHHL